MAAHSVSPPLVRTSTTVFDTLDAYTRAQSGTVFKAPRYGRSGTTTTFELQNAMASLSRAQSCIATSSGLSAIAAVLSAHARAGARLLLSEGIYGPSQTFCDKELVDRGVKVDVLPTGEDASRWLHTDTRLVFVETPSSLTMQMLNLRAICEAAHARGIPVACDATWGTPIYFDAHGQGIDIAVHSATKFINGHSDLLLGLITGSDEALSTVRAHCDRNGTHAAPDTCWLTLRGMRTLAVRLERHQRSAMVVAQWLQCHPAVRRVLYPALVDDPGHALWAAQFSGAAGPFVIELAPCSDSAFARFIDGLQLFSLGTSWGGFESLVMPAVPHHLRALPASGNSPRRVRLHIGLEDPGDLCDDLAQAICHLSPEEAVPRTA